MWLYVLLISRLFQSIVISHFTFHYLLHLGCIGYGGLICRIKEAKLCSLSGLRDERFLPFAFIFYSAFKVAITRGRVSKLLNEKSVLKNSDFRAPKNWVRWVTLGVSKTQVAMHSHSHSRHIREIRIQCARKLYVFNSLRQIIQICNRKPRSRTIHLTFNSFNFISRRTQENCS